MFPLVKLSPLSLSRHLLKHSTPFDSFFSGFLEQHRRIRPSPRNWNIMTLFINFDWYFLSSSSLALTLNTFFCGVPRLLKPSASNQNDLQNLLFLSGRFSFRPFVPRSRNLAFFVVKLTSLRGFWHQNEARLAVWEIWNKKVYASCAHYSTEWKERTCCVLVHTKWSKAKRTPERSARREGKNYENSKQNHNFPQTIKLNITKWLNIFNIDCCIAFIINFQPLHPPPAFTSPLIVLLLRLSCHRRKPSTA